MSVLQVEDLVSYQLRASYLNEFADGVGERLITLNESIVNSAPFKAAGWRTNPGLIKRTHSPPIPTAVASEYFRAPRSLGFTLEDELDDSGGLLGGGARGGMGGDLGRTGGGPGGPGRLGGDSLMSGAGGALTGSSEMAGPAITAATKRRRRREQMEEDDDSSDLSDESDDDGTAEQRAAQQIKFAKMPTRFRSGSSPLQSSNLRQPPIGPPDSPPTPSTVAPPSRGSISQSQSQSALESVKERARRDTVTSSEVSSENEFDASGFHRLRERERATSVAAAAAAAAAAGMGGTGGHRTRQRQASSKTVRMRSNSSAGSSGAGSLKPTVRRQDSDLLEEEREEAASDDDDESDGEDGEDGEDGSDLSSTFAGSIDSASILHADADNPLNAPTAQDPIIGTPPREFTRTSTVRRSQHPAMLEPVGELPPPRPMSTMRPVSTVAPRSLLTAALQAKKSAAAMPFERFASFSGKGDPNPILVRIYAPQSTRPTRPFEVPIRPTVHQEQGPGERPVTVADLIGLSLWRYSEEKCEPPLPAGRLHVNWWTLRMVEEGGEVDDDFPPLERTRPLTSFTTVNNSSKTTGTRFRSNSKVYDEFALVVASAAEFAENQRVTPQYEEEKGGGGAEPEGLATTADRGPGLGGSDDGDRTPRNATPQPGAVSAAAAASAASGLARLATGDRQFAPLDQPRLNPIITTTYRHNAPHADAPAVPAAVPNTARGRKKMLRVHIHSADAPPGQLITIDVTTDTYLEEVLDMVCRKRQLDKASHVLKLTGSGAVVRTDRPVASLDNVVDLDLYRKRFATEGSATGSPLGTSSGFVAAASSPKMLASYGAHSRRAAAAAAAAAAAISASVSASASAMPPNTLTMPGVHPLAREVSDASYKQYTVWRRQGLKLMGSSERVITIDGEYVHIGGASTGKITTVHFSNVVGCKVSLRHPTHFKLIVYKATESKRYDFEVKSADEASEIVAALKKAMSPYRDI